MKPNFLSLLLEVDKSLFEVLISYLLMKMEDALQLYQQRDYDVEVEGISNSVIPLRMSIVWVIRRLYRRFEAIFIDIRQEIHSLDTTEKSNRSTDLAIIYCRNSIQFEEGLVSLSNLLEAKRIIFLMNKGSFSYFDFFFSILTFFLNSKYLL